MEIPGEQIADLYRCVHCNQPALEQAGYCHYCGALQSAPDIDDAVRKQRTFIALTVFFGLYLAVCLVINFTVYVRGLIPLLAADGLLSLFTIVYVVIFWTELKKRLRWDRFSLAKLTAYSAAAVAGAIVVNYAVKWLNKTIFDSESYYYFAFSHLKYARLVTILVVSLQPAIFEELAFRGVLQQGLNKIMDARQAIFISAFLFALLHMSFIAFFWLMPFAWWMGNICKKEKTIWYGVVIHFCFNSTACFLEFFELNLF